MNIAGRGARNLVRMMAGHFATVSVLVVSGFLLPRYLGAVAYGSFAAILAVVTIAQTAADLGLQQVEERYLSPLWHNPEQRSAALQLGSTLWSQVDRRPSGATCLP